MAEIYRYKGKLFVIRKPGEHNALYARDQEVVFQLAKNGTERPVNWHGDVIRTLGQGVTGWKGETDGILPAPSRNCRPVAAHASL